MLYNMKKIARIPVSEARKNFAKLLDLASKGTRVKVTRYNQTLGGIISGDDLISLKDCDEEKATALARKRRQNEKHARNARSR
jgi:PHD/YefM family antitoxin component YafN of YafNO toxin-antitoxin module